MPRLRVNKISGLITLVLSSIGLNRTKPFIDKKTRENKKPCFLSFSFATFVALSHVSKTLEAFNLFSFHVFLTHNRAKFKNVAKFVA